MALIKCGETHSGAIKMKSKIKTAILLLEMEDGSLVQRPMKTVEINFVMPMLQEFDGGTMNVFPAEGITLEKKS